MSVCASSCLCAFLSVCLSRVRTADEIKPGGKKRSSAPHIRTISGHLDLRLSMYQHPIYILRKFTWSSYHLIEHDVININGLLKKY